MNAEAVMNIELATQAAHLATQSLDGTEGDQKAFLLVMEFLDQFPERLSLKTKLPSPDTLERYVKLAHAFFKARNKIVTPKMPETIPDEMVSHILQVYFDVKLTDLERIKIEHQLCMAAENMVGALLERYIASILENHGWAWCSGDFVHAVDMIKKQDDHSWELLQIKNRDNTENSSSSAIRKGTNINKWFRSFSKKKGTNWSIFPDEETRGLFSEEGFQAFVSHYLLSAKTASPEQCSLIMHDFF
jgi:hypothetical protein